jgi:hypothetical protein
MSKYTSNPSFKRARKKFQFKTRAKFASVKIKSKKKKLTKKVKENLILKKLRQKLEKLSRKKKYRNKKIFTKDLEKINKNRKIFHNQCMAFPVSKFLYFNWSRRGVYRQFRLSRIYCF